MTCLTPTNLIVFWWMATVVCHATDTCPDIKIIGLGEQDKLAVLQGCPGFPGAPGAKGETGPPGVNGEKGDQGICGEMGPAGETGQKGDPGIPGEVGPPGATGAKGEQGIAGIPGAPGSKGEKGDSGLPGGPTGETGQKGEPGIAGAAGPPGATGANGEQGIAGIPGLPGSKGDKGDSCEPSTTGARNCKELLQKGTILSGWYTIYPEDGKTMTVFCDMDTDGGGWIVFQRRVDGSVDFFRDWNMYKRGFGNRLTEFWLGNDNLHYLTSLGIYELRIDLKDFERNSSFAKYSAFKIAGESEKYKLIYEAFTDGNAGNSLVVHQNQPFSTIDRDNDSSTGRCAEGHKGGWWYNNCHRANLNGLYLGGKHSSYADGINWYNGKGYNYSYKTCEMKFRPV
ncbi:hypothetical protein NDU88_012008 [Pleurodeles waltl]|uniref:Fibrinogen C-terminal domain-containing protein n=1 Tax=Pleurodeles waltl TaxID=8319 RepID=A0AAV7QYZ8_PLEWA|nr:hypothetical protein NDU88_012008 [Pleurodeles waltl]